MPRRHVMRHVEYARGCRPSAVKLDKLLTSLNYAGPSIRWGLRGMNKHNDLLRMQAAGVPTLNILDYRAMMSVMTLDEACGHYVGRSDQHQAGSGLWHCHNPNDVVRAHQAGATHWMEWLTGVREFRVHITHGQSIKLQEKLTDQQLSEPGWANHFAERGWDYEGINGRVFVHPGDTFNHKRTLRNVAKRAVDALGHNLGAVDVLWKPNEDWETEGGAFYVLEANTAPALTSPNNTAALYAQAITTHNQPEATNTNQ